MAMRRRWQLVTRLVYTALTTLVLVGLAVVHGGSGATSAGGHGPMPTSPHAEADRQAVVTMPHLANVVASSTGVGRMVADRGASHDDTVAGCVLALTGILGLALGHLARSASRRRHCVGRASRRGHPPYLQRPAGPPLIPGLLCCVLRT